MLNRIIKRYLFLPPILLLTVRVLLSALFLFLVFNNQKETAWYAYLAYVYSFYTLCLVVVRVVFTIKKEKKKAEIEAKKEAIRQEDIAKGVFVPVAMLPTAEPKKGVASV